MVSFQCDGCADTVKKPKLDQHRQKCWASFTCLDCSTTFQGQQYKSHTSCISEAEKYQGSTYRAPRKNVQNGPLPKQNGIKPQQSAVAETQPSPTAPSIHPSRLRLWGNSGPPTPSGNSQASSSRQPSPKRDPSDPPRGVPVSIGAVAAKATKAESKQPSSGKRKAEALDADAMTATPEKLVKKMRKNLRKLDMDGSPQITLHDWLETVSSNKNGKMDTDQVLKMLKVTYSDGAWVINV